MSKSNYLEDAILDHVLPGYTTLTPPASLYVALFTTDPTDADSGTEVSGGGYARLEIGGATGRAFSAASGGSRSNSADWEWPAAASANWGTVSHFGIYDALTGGNLYYHAALTASKQIDTNDTARFLSGQLTVTED